MAVPIKSNNTQQGCNPISSNCVIWQGPNIPCINLCTGDSVSDVVAKMATELCEISSQLDISLLDLSCFNPLCPTPENFRDVMQLILNKICALENGTTADGVNTSGCPADCEIAVAPCLQYTDFLGNTVSSLPIKDYVILIGNKICTLLTSIANLQSQIDSLDTRVTNLENNSSGTGSSSFSVESDCLASGPISLIEYINLLDAAFCQLQNISGTQDQYITAASTAQQCITGSSVQMAEPPFPMGRYDAWIPSASNTVQQIQNLWVAVCDIRTGLTKLQDQLASCCAGEAACPTNLPIPTIEIDKSSASGYLFFTVTTPSGVTIASSGNILIGGEEWKLSRFVGTVTPSSTGLPVSISPVLPNSSVSTGPTNYSGTPNRFYELTAISSSIAVTVAGLFYWENVTTGQECAVTPSNNLQRLTTVLTACPSLPGSPSPNFAIVPATSPVPCNAVSGASVNISLVGFIPVTSASVTGSAFVQTTITYTNLSGSVIAQNFNFSNTSTNISIPNIGCSSNVTLQLQNTTQNGVVITCQGSYTIAIDSAPTP